MQLYWINGTRDMDVFLRCCFLSTGRIDFSYSYLCPQAL